MWGTEKLNPMLGFAPGEPISGESFLTRVHPEDREPTRQALRRALEEKSEYSAEYRVLLPDGRQRWIAARGRVETPARGGAVRMLGVCMDITARKQDEAEMLRLHADLAHTGRVSTMAQLASGLAHELNQPLGAILRNAEAILADICKDDHRAGEVIDHMRALLKRRGLERVELDRWAARHDERFEPVDRLRGGRRPVVSPGRLAVAEGRRSSGEGVLLGLRVRREPAGEGPRLRDRGPADAGPERPGPAGGAGRKRQSLDIPTSVHAMRLGAEDFLTKRAPRVWMEAFPKGQ